MKIRDQGPGVPVAQQDRVFEKFYRKGDREGSGLGLAICKSIVETHQGSIGIISDGIKGSCFHLSLPADDGNALRSEEGFSTDEETTAAADQHPTGFRPSAAGIQGTRRSRPSSSSLMMTLTT